jgi:hypothetical protein
MRALFTALGWLGVATLLLAVLLQTKSDIYGFPSNWGEQYARHGQNRGELPPMGQPFVLGSLEGFTENKEKESKEVNGRIEQPFGPSGNPADAPSLSSTYSLLPLQTKPTPGTLSAKTCYESDFLAQSQKVGNYIQRTNNIRHASPDSCTAPLTELVDSFYQNPILPH